MEKNLLEEDILQFLDGKNYHLDKEGRIIIDDPELSEKVKGGFGMGGGGIGLPDPMWNAACSNSRCS
jgi:hypothetical protein